ncbi:hypothetical protein [Actinomadura keratinilytica]|uniref:hypothetical protein n=1 Tax=Actinomadura keratinilytica TaxID=547461 RepID=UPI003620F4BB
MVHVRTASAAHAGGSSSDTNAPPRTASRTCEAIGDTRSASSRVPSTWKVSLRFSTRTRRRNSGVRVRHGTADTASSAVTGHRLRTTRPTGRPSSSVSGSTSSPSSACSVTRCSPASRSPSGTVASNSRGTASSKLDSGRDPVSRASAGR